MIKWYKKRGKICFFAQIIVLFSLNQVTFAQKVDDNGSRNKTIAQEISIEDYQEFEWRYERIVSGLWPKRIWRRMCQLNPCSAEYGLLVLWYDRGDTEWDILSVQSVDGKNLYIITEKSKKTFFQYGHYFRKTVIDLTRHNWIVGQMQYVFDSQDSCYVVRLDAYIQKQGYGTILVQNLFEELKRAAYKVLRLYSVIKAVPFYKKLGFVHATYEDQVKEIAEGSAGLPEMKKYCA